MGAEALKSSQGSQVEYVFGKLLNMVLDGTYPEKARLPAERTLAEELGTSRGTLREALRRMGDWNIIEARHGSGMVVRPQAEWLFDVLPSYLRFSVATMDNETLVPALTELLALEVDLMVMVMRFAARQARPEKLEAARALVDAAWAARHDPLSFMERDFQFIRALVAAGDFLPAQWLMNRLGGIFLEAGLSFAGVVPVPQDYLKYNETLLALLATHDEDAVEAHVRLYMAQMNAMTTKAVAAAAQAVS